MLLNPDRWVEAPEGARVDRVRDILNVNVTADPVSGSVLVWDQMDDGTAEWTAARGGAAILSNNNTFTGLNVFNQPVRFGRFFMRSLVRMFLSFRSNLADHPTNNTTELGHRFKNLIVTPATGLPENNVGIGDIDFNLEEDWLAAGSAWPNGVSPDGRTGRTRMIVPTANTDFNSEAFTGNKNLVLMWGNTTDWAIFRITRS